MKKQLIAAAVAATMTSVAMADISITGAAKVNYTSTDFDLATSEDQNKVTHEMDLKVLGKSGDTSVVINFGDIDSTNTSTTDTGMNIEDAYVSTTVMGASLKAGQWDNGNNALRASARNDGKVSVSKEFSGVTVTFDAESEATSAANMSDSVKVAATIAGVDVSYKGIHTGEDISVSTEIAGVSLSYLALNRDAATSDRTVIEASGSIGGFDVTVAQANADASACITGDSWMGDFEHASDSCTNTDSATNALDLRNGQDVTAVKVSTALSGNTLAFTHTSIDGSVGEDTTQNKVVLTRPLANGTTFEATYTEVSDDGQTATDKEVLDLELSVKF